MTASREPTPSRRRVGHLFQGRFKGILVQKEAYLLELARYIVLNPVRAGMVADPAAWGWSSYRATVGLEPKPPYLTTVSVQRNTSIPRAARSARCCHVPRTEGKQHGAEAAQSRAMVGVGPGLAGQWSDAGTVLS
jgi:hypothetical protein